MKTSRNKLGDRNVFLVNTTGWVTFDDVFPEYVGSRLRLWKSVTDTPFVQAINTLTYLDTPRLQDFSDRGWKHGVWNLDLS